VRSTLQKLGRSASLLPPETFRNRSSFAIPRKRVCRSSSALRADDDVDAEFGMKVLRAASVEGDGIGDGLKGLPFHLAWTFELPFHRPGAASATEYTREPTTPAAFLGRA
jgi:hypothetical protein